MLGNKNAVGDETNSVFIELLSEKSGSLKYFFQAA